MKRRNYTLFVLCSLLLMGCKDKVGPSSSSQSGQSENVPTESSKPSESTPSISSKPSDSGGKEESSKPSASVDLYANWPTEIKEFLKENLGGTLVPYINLGGKTALVYDPVEPDLHNSYDDYHLEIYGSASYATSLTSSFSSAYKADGYAVEEDDGKRKAVKESVHLTVTLSDEDGLATRKIYYDEPYDKNKFTEYPENVKEELAVLFPQHSKDIPLVYLGTNTPTFADKTDSNTAGPKALISGRKWNDRILTDTKATLEASGFSSVTDQENSKVEGEKTFEDGYTRKITVSKVASENNGDYGQREILLTEPYIPSSITSWPEEISDLFPDYFDGHVLPFFYRGTKTPTVSTKKSDRTGFYVKGGVYDDRIRANAITVLQSNGWTEDTAEETKYASFDNILVRTKQDTDSCKLKIRLYNRDGTALLDVSYTPTVFGDASSFTSWPQYVKDAFDQNFQGLPYPPALYLGKALSVGTCTNGSLVELKAAVYFDDVRSNALTFLGGKGWAEDTDIEQQDQYKNNKNILVMVSPADEVNHIKWQIALYKTNSSRAVCEFSLIHLYNPADSPNAYSDEVKDRIKDNLGGRDIPYVYLGSQDLDPYFDEDYSNLIISAPNVAFDKGMITRAKTAFKDWTLVEEEEEEVTYAKHDSAKGFALVHIYPYSDKKTPTREISYLPYKGETEYPSSIKGDIDKRMDNQTTLPYLFLGEEGKVTMTKNNGSLVLQGEARYNDAMFYLFNKQFSASGWSVDRTKKTATYTKDGYTFTASLGRSIGNDGYLTKLTLSADVPYHAADQATRSYTEEEKTLIHDALGNKDIPMPYLGTKNYTIAKGTSKDKANGLTITGGKWNEARIADNKKVRTDAGFTVYEKKDGDAYKHNIGYGSAASLQGYKQLGSTPADGYIRFIITRTGYKTAPAIACFYYDAPVSLNDDSTATSKWTENTTIQSNRQNALKGTLPYFDLGSNVVSYYYATSPNKLKIKANSLTASKQSYIRNAFSVLKEHDSTREWVSYDFSYQSYGRKAIWQGSAADGNVLTYTVTSSTSSLEIEIVHSEKTANS